MVSFVCTGTEWYVENQNFGANFDAWADYHNVGRLGNVNAYTKAQYYIQQSLTDGATVDWDIDAMPSAKLLADGDRTINNPTSSIRAEVTYILMHKQNATTGGRNPSWASKYNFSQISGGSVPDLSSRTVNQEDVFIFIGDVTNDELRCLKHDKR